MTNSDQPTKKPARSGTRSARAGSGLDLGPLPPVAPLVEPDPDATAPIAPASAATVPIAPASAATVPIAPASAATVPIAPASAATVPIAPASAATVPIAPAPHVATAPTLGNATAPQSVPIPPADQTAVVEARVAKQLAWYDDHAQYSRLWYLTVKVIQLVLAAGVPVAASVHAPVALTGSLGAAIVVLEGAQQLFQWHDNWIRYRTTATALASQKGLYEARAGDYQNDPDPSALLASRVEALSTAETASWAQSSRSDTSASGATT